MNDWNDGYFTDSTYTMGYYRELSPVFQRFCLLVKGFLPPPEDEGSVHCELGFGQGVSAAIHAAATPGKYFGTDFNPSHAANAGRLARASGCGARFMDASFAELLEMDDVPQFDSVSLHGIWSWISAENQKHVIEFTRRHLKPGGVFYNSYNCFPGWAPKAPLREIFSVYDRFAHQSTNTYKRVEESLKFTSDLLAANPAYLRRSPWLSDVLETMKKDNHDYFAHEYLNRDWTCVYFADMAEMLGAAKLDFACSANPLDAIDTLNLSEAARSFLGRIEHPIIREQTRDYFINQQFRKDLYMRGAERMSAPERKDAIFSTRFALLTADDVPADFQAIAGKASMPPDLNKAVVDYLAQNDYKPKSFDRFLKEHPNTQPALVEQMIIILAGRGVISPCQPEETVKAVKKKCDALNSYFFERAKAKGDIPVIASPVLGGGFALGRFNQIFASFCRDGKKDAAKIARETWGIIAAQGMKLVKNGAPIESPEGNISELESAAKSFMEKNLPILKAIEVI